MAKKKTSPQFGENEVVDIGSITRDPDNLNVRTDVEDIRASLREFGQHKAVVVQRSSRQIIIGNHTHEAAEDEGWSELEVKWVDDDNAKALRRAVADNRTGEFLEWDEFRLENVLKGFDDNLPPGFDAAFVDDLTFRLHPPEDEVNTSAGGGDDPGDAFWPVIRVKVSPTAYRRWNALAENHKDERAFVGYLLKLASS